MLVVTIIAGEEDVKKQCSIVEMEDKLQNFYDFIGCDTVTFPIRRIGNKCFTIICDDEGLLKSDSIPSACSFMTGEVLVGNLIICSGEVTDDGDLIGLTKKDAEYIIDNMGTVVMTNNKAYSVLELG